MPNLDVNAIHLGRSEDLLARVAPESIALSFWSPPYFVGKDYELGATLESWQETLKRVICGHAAALKPGGFMVINIADILTFRDELLPRFQAANPRNHRSPVTREAVLEAKRMYPTYGKHELAALLGCSEQTIDRRLNGNNIRGGKYEVQTRVKLVGHHLDEYAYSCGMYLYDVRIWKKDPAWANSRWTSNTLKAVSETEDLYVFHKPGEYAVQRSRLSDTEWREWGYRQVWEIDSVRKNDDHPAKFPLELARRVVQLYSDPGDIVMDPFVGSGTTAVAAVLMGRQFVGIDSSPKYVSLARANVESAMERQPLFEVS